MKQLKKLAISMAVILFILTNIKASLGTTGKITAETIRIRASASTESKIVEIGNLGEKVEILSEEGDWYKVSFKGKQGYIYKSYLKADGEVATTTKEENTTAESNTTNTTTTVPENTIAETTQNQTVETSNEPATNTAVDTTTEEKVMELGNVITKETYAYLLPNFTSVKLVKLEKDKTIKLNTTMANWAKIEVDGKEAWIPKIFLMKEVDATQPEQTTTDTTTEEPVAEQPEATTTPATATATENLNKSAYISSNASAHLRSGPSTTSESLGKLPKNTKITIISEENGWYKVSYNGKEGYISSALVTEGEPPATTSTSSASSRGQEEPRTVATVNSDNVVQVAQGYLGNKYVSGGTTPAGFDCSGFTQYVYAQCGKSISRTSYTQANEGTAVSKSDLQPGDLLLFHYNGSSSIGHVGIYVGNGQFIHAANAKRGVVYDTINSGYYATNYAGARRL